MLIVTFSLAAWASFRSMHPYAGLLKSPQAVLQPESILLQLLLRLFQLFLQLLHPALQLVDGLLHPADVFHVDLLRRILHRTHRPF